MALRIEGFTAFRERVEIDFSDADLFVLSGPTGSGKSSVIDAICFALYGSIPRLNGIAPLVSVGVNEARVELTFDADGRRWTVTRLVVRTSSGASQKDVRFEGPDEVVAGVREVDARIEELVGLGFEHFTRCVVLPQGRFAAFLEDTPGDRQDLLEQLLDLGLFDQMRSLASTRARHLEAEERAVSAQLHDITVDQEQIDEAVERLASLDRFLERSSTVRQELDDLTARTADAQRRATEASDRLGAVAAIDRPEGIDEFADAVAEAAEAVERTTAAVATVSRRVDELRTERDALGEVAAIEAALTAHERVRDLSERVEHGEKLVGEASEAHARAAREAEAALERVEAARAARDDLAGRHAAHGLRVGLGPGDDCPVCLRRLDEVPDVDAPAALAEADVRLVDAMSAAEGTATALREAETHVAGLSARLEERRAELEAARTAAQGLDPVEVLEGRRNQHVELTARLTVAESDLDRSQKDAAVAERARDRLAEREEQLASGLDRARDRVAALSPPVPGRRDVVADWRALVAWAEESVTSLTGARDEATSVVADLQASRDALRNELAEAAAAVGIDSDGDLRERAVAVRAGQEATIGRLREELARAERFQSKLAELIPSRKRYLTAERLLRSNKFPQWVVTEAMEDLVAYANETLSTLAASAYSLRFSEAEFVVVDHRNADARRSVRTLSGGETFLVSLSLALALAERVATAAGTSTARIESMFLDEGFGTLDSETLDVVASVVTELGSGNRMVGLITHVRELAEQIPTRFEVRKRPGGATVERFDT